MDLKTKRKEIGLTNIEIAKKLGISKSYLSQIESGKRKIDSKLINGIAEVYNLNIDEVKKAAEESNARVKVYNSWIAQIRINKEPLHKAFSRELKYFPLKDSRDESEILYRLIAFIDKNIAHSVRDELVQNINLFNLFIEKLR
jgi:transcriptional regulator with XRE-family HTH domain